MCSWTESSRDRGPASPHLYLAACAVGYLVYLYTGWESQQPHPVAARITFAIHRTRTGHLPTVGTAEVVRVVGIILEHEGLFVNG